MGPEQVGPERGGPERGGPGDIAGGAFAGEDGEDTRRGAGAEDAGAEDTGGGEAAKSALRASRQAERRVRQDGGRQDGGRLESGRRADQEDDQDDESRSGPGRGGLFQSPQTGGPMNRPLGRKGGRVAGKGKGDPDLTPIIIRPVAPAARARRRHWMILASFLGIVVLPAILVAGYLWIFAVDQYASTVGFSVRSEESRPTSDLLGQLSQLSGASSADTDVLYEFIQSQELVTRLDARLDLAGRYSRHLARDPVFSYHPDGTIEDLVDYWSWMVRIAYDPGTGLMEIVAKAFDPQDAQDIAQAIFDESTLRTNELSAIAREDATRYAREELALALERLRNAREAVTAFRMRSQIVDPAADIQGQMGLLNTLQAQLAAALIDLDLLRDTTRESDPRIGQLERRIEVIRARIADERSRFGAGGQGPGGEDYATLVAEFERLTVDREFAEQAYMSALSTYDAALAGAQRTSRYLAAHIKPTLAESPRYPERGVILGLCVLFGFLIWAMGVLIYYSVRDRR
ncbi:sugar transporter [Paracoccaceae bacterium Fryx2]|nr:sugar transporter [Paracoccaceae bacterium Fryx2]